MKISCLFDANAFVIHKYDQNKRKIKMDIRSQMTGSADRH